MMKHVECLCLEVMLTLAIVFILICVSESKTGKMCDPDSSFEMELERASSEREVQLHEVVPRDILFKIKFKEANGKTFNFFEYLLKEGISLPYELALKGKFFLFACIRIY